jgi:chemotaxis protein MotA
MTLLMEGMLAVQAGSPPHFVGERLRAMASQRPAEKAPKKEKSGRRPDPEPTRDPVAST